MARELMMQAYNFDKVVWSKDLKGFIGYDYGTGTTLRAYVYMHGEQVRMVFRQMGF